MNRIRLLRKAKGYSQKELGKRIGVSLQTVSNWERSVAEPSLIDINNLCHEFQVTADYLLGRTEANDYKVELYGEQIPKSLRDAGLERVQLLREYIDENGGIHPDVQRELLRLIAEAKLLQDTSDPEQ